MPSMIFLSGRGTSQTLGALALSLCLLSTMSMTAFTETIKSDNLKVTQRFKLPAGNEIGFDGARVYVGGYGSSAGTGVHSFEIKGSKLRKTGDLVCHGINDVAPLDKGFVAIGLQRGGSRCNSPSPAGVGGYFGGVQVADMSTPSRPTLRGGIEIPGGVHTLTRYPGKPLVYTAMGGADAWTAFGGVTHILDISDPEEPAIAATYQSRLNPAGCHDVLFEKIDGKTIGFCPGLGGTEIWDASDPLAPQVLGRMTLPALQLPHRVAVSSDGQVAAVSDEAYAGHACQGGTPVGALWFYDISDLAAPALLGYYGPQRGNAPVGAGSGSPISCTGHNFNFIPDSRLIVMSWIAGGTQVLDVTDPTAVKEVAYYRPEGAVHMSSYWYRGSIFVADMGTGLDVLKLHR